MTKENVEIVQRLFDAVERRDLAGVLAAYDQNIIIREADSLPYGGVYHGYEGAQKHAAGYVETWGPFQTAAEQKLDATFLDAGDYVVVLWRQRGLASDNGRRVDLPATSIYKLRNGRIIESQMFHADTATLLKFLSNGS